MTYAATTKTKSHEPSSFFWDRIATRYSRKPIANIEVYEAKLAITQQYLDPAMEVLELGCGTGGTTMIHADHVKRIVATDLSPAMIEIARKRLESSKIRNVEFMTSSVESLGLAPRSVDAVLGLSLLHLLKDRNAAIRKVADALRPGGLFVTSTPCLANGMGWMRFVQPVGSLLGIMPEFTIFSKDTLQREFVEAGFRIEEEFEPDDGRTLFMIARIAAN